MSKIIEKRCRSIWFSCLIFCFFSGACQSKNDRFYKKDVNGNTYLLTTLARFLVGPWEFDRGLGVYNLKVSCQDSLVTDSAQVYTEIQKQIVFQLYDGGGVRYWFRKDYVKDPIDTTTNEHGTTIIKPYKPAAGQIRKVYSEGKWSFNESDSTISIHLGSATSPALILDVKYVYLSTGMCTLRKSFLIDSLKGDAGSRCSRIETYTMAHPWYDRSF